MGSVENKGWTVSWRNMGDDNHIAMFANPRTRTNMIYTETQIHDAIDGREETSISKSVLIDALVAYSVEQIQIAA